MNLFIHDLSHETDISCFLPTTTAWHVVSEKGALSSCKGCFDCWVKTPGQCILHDGYETLSQVMGACDSIRILSRCIYGSESPFVKSVLDRSIGYVLPLFTIRKGCMRHRRRYKNTLKLQVLFYGVSPECQEAATARRLVDAQARNMMIKHVEVSFYETLAALKAAVL